MAGLWLLLGSVLAKGLDPNWSLSSGSWWGAWRSQELGTMEQPWASLISIELFFLKQNVQLSTQAFAEIGK